MKRKHRIDAPEQANKGIAFPASEMALPEAGCSAATAVLVGFIPSKEVTRLKARVAFLAAVSCMAFAGCTGSGSHTGLAPVVNSSSSQKTAEAVHRFVANLEQKLPAGTRVYQTDSVVIHSGDAFAQFAAGARITRTASSIVVFDPQSQQTFTFPSTSSVEYASGTSRAYVAPGEAVPAWVAQSHGRVERTL